MFIGISNSIIVYLSLSLSLSLYIYIYIYTHRHIDIIKWRIRGGRLLRKHKVNGSRHYSTCNIVKRKRKYGLNSSDIHGKKLFIGYFALGIFGSPEKDRAYVLLMLQHLTFLSWEPLLVHWFWF